MGFIAKATLVRHEEKETGLNPEGNKIYAGGTVHCLRDGGGQHTQEVDKNTEDFTLYKIERKMWKERIDTDTCTISLPFDQQWLLTSNPLSAAKPMLKCPQTIHPFSWATAETAYCPL